MVTRFLVRSRTADLSSHYQYDNHYHSDTPATPLANTKISAIPVTYTIYLSLQLWYLNCMSLIGLGVKFLNTIGDVVHHNRGRCSPG